MVTISISHPWFLNNGIKTKNYRSQKAHEKVGFITIHTYNDALDEWNVVAWDEIIV
ncbi:MAG: hypothetical protein ACR2KX_11945 [Chitinophagaceae bacterium]